MNERAVAPRRVAIAGATGLIGRALSAALRERGATIVTIGRRRADVQWDPGRGGLDPAPLEGLDAVVNLAGAQIGRRWTAVRKRAIRESRVRGTALIARALASCRNRPRVLVNASAVGYYGDAGDRVLTEASPAGNDFLAGVTREWEAATAEAERAGIRVVMVRTGIVLSREGGVIPPLLTPFRLGLGGPLGSGRQWMSWIGLHDLVRAIVFVMDHDVRGTVNAVAPEPVTNAAFTKTLATVLHRPAVFRVPAFALRAVFGEMAQQTILASQRAMPQRLLAAGFVFDEPTLEGAVRRALGATRIVAE